MDVTKVKYISPKFGTIKREEALDFAWVYRDINGKFKDCGIRRHDLAAKHGLVLKIEPGDMIGYIEEIK